MMARALWAAHKEKRKRPAWGGPLQDAGAAYFRRLSMTAFSVALGRMAWPVFAASGR